MDGEILRVGTVKVRGADVEGRVQVRRDDGRDRGIGPPQGHADVADRGVEKHVAARHRGPLDGDAPAEGSGDVRGRLIEGDDHPEHERDHDGDRLEREVAEHRAAEIETQARQQRPSRGRYAGHL